MSEATYIPILLKEIKELREEVDRRGNEWRNTEAELTALQEDYETLLVEKKKWMMDAQKMYGELTTLKAERDECKKFWNIAENRLDALQKSIEDVKGLPEKKNNYYKIS